MIIKDSSMIFHLFASPEIREAHRQLHQNTVYKVLDFDNDPTEAIIAEITVTLNRLANEGVITQDMANYANPRDTKPGRFYLLPKVHKCGVPGRPVISSCSSPTEKISELVDHFIKPLVPGIPSYIRDSFHFLEKLKAIGSLQENFLLVTIDVVGLYPSIPHEDGLSSFRISEE